MEGAAQSLVSNVGNLVGKEFQQLRGVGGEVARMRNQLATMNALLCMESEADEGAVDHFVREWMKQLREVAYDAEDCVDLYLFRVRCRSGDPLFVRCKRLFRTLVSRHYLASDIRALCTLASAINEEHARYGVSLEPLRRTAAASEQSAVAAPMRAALCPDNDDPDQFVGNKAQAIDLASKVKALNVDNDKKLKVFSIVGFGGLGKTTLALEVCRQLEPEFQHQAQVSVSQTFSHKDLPGLFRRVLRQTARPKQTKEGILPTKQADPLANIDTMDADDLERVLKERLEDKRYLILIDDLWSTAAWYAIRSKLPSNSCGSRIIVTTRIDNVAKACSDANTDHIHKMEKLNFEDSKQLFESKAFGSAGNPCREDQFLKDKTESILRKCSGLPLAIVSIASLLASYKPPEGKNMWEIVERSIGSQMENNPTLEGMRQILKLSYIHLPHHLKACMMYLSIFPEDHMICKDRLLKRWIAEGLVAEKRGLSQMEIAEGYFNELISRSIIDRVDGREERCRVHDMMLEILLSKSLESNFVSIVGGQYEGMSYANTIRRLSIHGRVEPAAHRGSPSKTMAVRPGTGSGSIKGIMVHHVRSLSVFDPEAHMLLSRLGEFTLLRVLDLEDCKVLGRKHMNCICRMHLLRFLSLKGTNIKVLPSRVGDLEHLQTLDVHETDLKRLPETVKKLDKLVHLLFSNKGTSSYDMSAWKLPQGINKMKALRQVNRAVIYDPKVAEEIAELDQLQELAIYVDTRECSKKAEDVAEKLASSLSKMYSLRWLEIGNFGCGEWPFVPIMNFLNEVESPPQQLRYLKICGHINILPDWVASLTDLAELDIVWTYLNCAQLFNVLCKLPNLKRLFLGAYFIRHSEDMVAGSSLSFPALKELTLGYSPEVPEVYRFEETSMPKLEKLVVNFGDQIKKIVGIEHLKNLKEVQYNGNRYKIKDAVDKLEELIKERRVSKEITVRVSYEDDM